MIAALAADAVLIFHLGFIAFAIFGGLLVVRYRHLIWLHVPVLAWGVWIEISHRICPLTAVENRLRNAAGQQGYGGGFIEHYLVPLIYPPGLNAAQQLVIGGTFMIWSLAIYLLIWRRRSRDR